MLMSMGGTPAGKESLDGGSIKGGILHARFQWLREQGVPGDAEGVKTAIRQRVSEATAEELSGPVLPIRMYAFRTLIEVDRAIAALVHRDEQSLCRELGRFSARVNLTGTYRFFCKPDPHQFFETAARVHRQFQDFGTEEYSRTGLLSCRISFVDSTCYAKPYCWSALGYFEQATLLHGGEEPAVRETECRCDGAELCRFEIGWKEMPPISAPSAAKA
jgi:predicted hydrocarbon binding protein